MAAIGLAVNLLSAWLLFDHDHHHAAGDDEAHGRDTNIRAAYLHVLADALTSILAIVALLAARFLNWVWLDPVMAIVGALVIAQWSRGLIRSAGAVLLDTVPSQHLVAEILKRLERGHDRVTDLHLWRLGPGHSGLIVTIISDRPEPPALYKERLAGIVGLSHVTVEVHHCQAHEQRRPTDEAAYGGDGALPLALSSQAVAREFFGDGRLDRFCRRDIGVTARAITPLALRHAPAIERGCELRADLQGRVVVRDRAVEITEFQTRESPAVERIGAARVEPQRLVTIRKRCLQVADDSASSSDCSRRGHLQPGCG